MQRVILISCAVFFVVAGEVLGDGEWTPDNVEIVPENPTSADVVDITFSGNWPDSCIPVDSHIEVDGNDIYFGVISDTNENCTQEITPWELTKSVAPLSPGVYRVYASLDLGPWTLVTEFRVAETNTYVFIPEQSTVVWTGGPCDINETYPIEGQFQLIVDFDANTASFDQVNACLEAIDTHLDGLLHLSDMTGAVVSDTVIEFESASMPGGVMGTIVLTIEGDSVHLVGAFSQVLEHPFYFELDAVARKKLVSDEVSWIAGQTSPSDWRVEPNCASTSDVIHLFGPTGIFGNSCSATVSVGGTPTLTIDSVNKTIELWFQPPPPYMCPSLWDPVCGLEGSFGPLEAGQWIFFGNVPNATFSIPFQVDSTIDSNSIVDNGIKYYMRTDKSVYKLDEQVEMLYRVTNLTSNSVDIGYILNCEDAWTHFAITDDGDADIWQFFRIIPPCGHIMFSLAPYESRECQMVWDMTNDNGTLEPDDDFHVGSGLYNIAGELELDSGYQRVPVSVTIEIIPFVYYVDADATGAGDGSSWADAFPFLQHAFSQANYYVNHYGFPAEIHVAQGTYKPHEGVLYAPELERKQSFQLVNGVTIKGGYAGFGEPEPDLRDIELYETILSGDLLNNDVGDLDDPSRDDNSYHVVTGSGTDATAVLDGFTITAGNANGSVKNASSGGGMFIGDYSHPTVFNCTFSGNSASSLGGGMFIDEGSTSTFKNCIFSGNSASNSGGGMYSKDECDLTLTNCLFTGNLADNGGGIYIFGGEGSHQVLTNCTFYGNTASSYGGGIYNSYHSASTLTNCILWSNSPDEIYPSTRARVSYSDIQGGWEGLGNIDLDPQPVDPNGGDWHLGAGSPCIDAGDNTAVPPSVLTDLDGNPRIVGGTVDMGAYEFQGFQTLYVDADAPQFGDGTSWATAFRHLQDALFNVIPPAEIRAAQGIYKPDLNTYSTAPPSREDTFQLKNGINLKGGYAGFGEPDPNARDIELYETILTGDLNGDDAEVVDPCDLLSEPTRAENSLHVVTGSGTDNTAVLDGFIIKSGNANGGSSQTAEGGGIYNGDGSPMLTNCTFTANSATNEGGGMYNLKSHPIVTNCTFNENSAAGVGGGGMFNDRSNPTVTKCTFVGNSSVSHGGGISNQYRSSPTISNCTFHSNSAQCRGGGLHNVAKAVLTNCTFTDNEASSEYGDGGGMHNDEGPILLTSCTFIGNRAGRSGGGIHNDEESDTTMNDCTFIGNAAVNYGGGMSNVYECTGTFTNCILTGNSSANNGGGVYNNDNNAMFANCIISGNSAVNDGGGMFNDGCAPILTNCTFSGNLAGENTGGIYNKGHCYMTLTNCVLWGDVPDELYVDQGIQVITYCDIQGGWTGEGNMDADPCFVEPGYWDPNGTPADANDDFWVDGDYHLLLNSACIDAGDPDYMTEPNETDLDGNPRIVNGTVDMGAYEFWGPIYVDDDAPSDPGPGDPAVSDPLENGTEVRPFDTIQEAINLSVDGYTVLVRQGSYFEPMSNNSIDFLGKNITLTSEDPTDWDIVDHTVIRGYVQFSGTEGPNCKFAGFRIGNLEGAIYGNHTHATISYCNISGNGACGVTVIKDCDGIISNCLITDNTTFALCGIYPVVFGCNGLIKNCTIANNESGLSVGNATIENCIIYNNTGSQLAVTNGNTADISYSNVQNGLAGIAGDGQVNWGPGNIDTDPCFVRLGYWIIDDATLIEGDYHLRSEGWRWNTEGKSWTYDYITSRCIDAGNPGSLLRGELMSVPRDPNNVWGVNLRINMGAYGGTGQASMPPHGWTIPADLTNDGMVNFLDFAYQTQDWLTTASEQPGDLNRDGVVNIMDLAALAENWLQVKEWVNQPPVVYITQPPDGMEFFWLTESVWIVADAWDVDGSVVKVEFFVNGNKIGEDNDGTDGWMDVTCFNIGTYILTAKATDNKGATITSPPVKIKAVECY